MTGPVSVLVAIHVAPDGTTFDMVNYRKSGGPFANASWNSVHFGAGDFISDFYGPVNHKKVDLPDKAAVTKYIKELARYCGSCAVGIADLGPDPLKWFKNDWMGRPLHFKPEENRYAIVTLHIEELADHPLPKDMSLATMRYYTKVSHASFFRRLCRGPSCPVCPVARLSCHWA